MGELAVRRCGSSSQALFTLVFVLVFNFFLFRIMPSDPVRLLTRQRGVQLIAGGPGRG